MEIGGAAAAAAGAVRHTVVGLFEDTIDAEQALVALRKGHHPAERVSLVVRDRAADEGGSVDRAGAVARAIVATALEAVGGWLHGLASLIVPERGTFLVAGPIGAALAGIGAGGAGTERAGAYAAATDLTAGGLLRTLTQFGFSQDEATYVEHRLAAGVALIAVTTNDASTLQSTRGLFGDHNAVYIGTAQTDAGFFEAAEALLNAPPEVSSQGDVVVTDAVAPIRRVTVEGGSPEAAALRHREVVTENGEEVGKVEEVLEEEVAAAESSGPPRQSRVVRYVVVGFGGVLGLGRHRVAVPATLVDLRSNPIRLRVDKRILERAPRFDEDAPFSRREERAVCAYFGITPYWLQA